MAPYILCYTLFLLAVLLALRSEYAKGKVHDGLRVGSLAVFFFSFYLNSLLVFFPGFLLFLLVCAQRHSRVDLKKMLFPFVLCHLDFLLLPFLHWVVKEL